MEVTANDATMKQHQAWREMWESETCRPFTTREIAFAEKVAAAERGSYMACTSRFDVVRGLFGACARGDVSAISPVSHPAAS